MINDVWISFQQNNTGDQRGFVLEYNPNGQGIDPTTKHPNTFTVAFAADYLSVKDGTKLASHLQSALYELLEKRERLLNDPR